MDLDPFLRARTLAAPATAARRRRPLSISPPAPTREPQLSARRARAGAARPEVRARLGRQGCGLGTQGPGGCVGPGWARERRPRARNAGLGSRGGGGRSLPRLDSQDCRSPCACAAPGGETGVKTSCPRVCRHRGCLGPMSRWSRRPEASVIPGQGSPWRGPVSRVLLQATSPERPRARAGLGARRRQGELEHGAAARPALWGGASVCAARSQFGVSAPSRPQTPHLGPGSLHSIPSNFRGR